MVKLFKVLSPLVGEAGERNTNLKLRNREGSLIPHYPPKKNEVGESVKKECDTLRFPLLTPILGDDTGIKEI